MKNPWPIKKIGEVVYFQEGPGLRTFQFKPNGIRVINVANVQDGFLDLIETKYLDPKEIKEKYQHFLVNEGDMLLSTSGTIGRVARVRKEDLPLMLNTSVMRLRSLNENTLLSQFLFYFLNSENFKKTLLSYKTGVAIFNVGPSHLKRIWLTLPPLPIQHQIVERLDAIKKAQELSDKQIALADELFSSLPNDFFRIGTNYKYVTFGNLISFGPQNGIYKTPEDFKENGNGNLIDINALYKGFSLSLDNPRKVILSDDELNTYRLENDDLLVNRVSKKIGGTGKTVIVAGLTNQSTVFESNMMRIKVIKGKVIPLYINYYLNSAEGRKQMLQHSQIANQASINQEGVKKINIPAPSIKIQHQIVEKLQAAQDYKKKLLEQKQKLQELFKSCLDKAMKGELVS